MWTADDMLSEADARANEASMILSDIEPDSAEEAPDIQAALVNAMLAQFWLARAQVERSR